MSKVIFLDIDGVLNNLSQIKKLIELLGESQYLTLLQNLREMPFDYRSCELLQKLIKNTGAEVVLSSTWRLSPESIRGIETYAKIKIKDITPNLNDIRGKEIQQYLDEHKEITNYVIIDDDSDMLESQKEHFVRTNFNIGFSVKELVECESILLEKGE